MSDGLYKGDCLDMMRAMEAESRVDWRCSDRCSARVSATKLAGESFVQSPSMWCMTRCGVSLGRIVSPKSPCSADMADLCTAYTQIGGEIYRRALAMKDREAKW